jgi:hypothetical protein
MDVIGIFKFGILEEWVLFLNIFVKIHPIIPIPHLSIYQKNLNYNINYIRHIDHRYIIEYMLME